MNTSHESKLRVKWWVIGFVCGVGLVALLFACQWLFSIAAFFGLG